MNFLPIVTDILLNCGLIVVCDTFKGRTGFYDLLTMFPSINSNPEFKNTAFILVNENDSVDLVSKFHNIRISKKDIESSLFCCLEKMENKNLRILLITNRNPFSIVINGVIKGIKLRPINHIVATKLRNKKKYEISSYFNNSDCDFVQLNSLIQLVKFFIFYSEAKSIDLAAQILINTSEYITDYNSA